MQTAIANNIVDNGNKENEMVKASIFGLIRENTLVNG